MALTTTVVSYPQRGRWGDPSYRGNCSGYLVQDILATWRPGRFLEVFAGGGTGEDVCNEIEHPHHTHLDLNPTFGSWNALSDDVPEGADLAFLHPPYHDIVRYSGAQWGDAGHPDDLSRCASYDEFITKLDQVHAKVYASLRAGGRFATLVGDVKKRGELFSIQHDMAWIGRPELHVIKLQHHVRSQDRTYRGSVIRIAHEHLLVFSKDDLYAVTVSRPSSRFYDLRRSLRPTWRDLVQAALEDAGGPQSLSRLYDRLADTAKAEHNPHWQAKVRQTLQLGDEFAPLRRGVWTLAQDRSLAAA